MHSPSSGKKSSKSASQHQAIDTSASQKFSRSRPDLTIVLIEVRLDYAIDAKGYKIGKSRHILINCLHFLRELISKSKSFFNCKHKRVCRVCSKKEMTNFKEISNSFMDFCSSKDATSEMQADTEEKFDTLEVQSM